MNFTSPQLPGSSGSTAGHETQWPRWPALVTSRAGAWRGCAEEDMEQPRKCFDHFDEANLDEEAKVRTLKLRLKHLSRYFLNVVPSG